MIVLKFGKNARTDGLFAAYGVYGVLSLIAQSLRITVVARLLEATLHFRVTTMTYHSVSSRRVKEYAIHPYRLAFAQGDVETVAAEAV